MSRIFMKYIPIYISLPCIHYVYTFLLGGYIYINFMTFRYIYRKRAGISRFFCHKGCDIFGKSVTNTPQTRRNQPFFL